MENQIFFVEPDTAQWREMWQTLASNEINAGLSDPYNAENHGEEWQYMESEVQKNVIIHTFRHYNHPATNEREYVRVEEEK